jgi:hypothetical protein
VQQTQWRSFRPGEITPGTIFYYAKEHGWRGWDREAADRPEFKENWLFVVGLKRFIELNTMQELDAEQFSARFAPMFKRGSAADHILRNEAFPRVDAVTYWPNHPRMVEECGLKKLNLWRPTPVVPVCGNVDRFLEHLEFILPDKDEREKIFLPYLAFNVRNPGVKIRWAVVLQGKQRTGKSYFGRMMTHVLGEHNVSRPTNERLHEKFTEWQQGAQLIVIEELMGLGRVELINKLKPMITEPTTSVRLPGGRSYEMPNRYNFLMFTNHKGALPVDEDDKRYCLLFSPAQRQPNAYYEALWPWSADQQNIAAIAHYLMHEVDLSEFRPNGNAPETEARKEAIEMNRKDYEVWIQESIEGRNGLFACDIVVVDHIRQCLPQHIRLSDVSRNALTESLERLGAKRVGRMTLPCGYPNVWAVRNAERWQTAGEGGRAKAYLDFLQIASGTVISSGGDIDGDIVAAMLSKVSQRGAHVTEMVKNINSGPM